MDPRKNELGNRLLIQQVSDPDKRARYQKEVDAMLEKIRQEDWWMRLAHAAVIVLFTLMLFLSAGILGYFTFQFARQPDPIASLSLALGWGLFFVAAFAILWHFNRRMRMNDVLVQVKGLEMRVLQLEESRGGGAN